MLILVLLLALSLLVLGTLLPAVRRRLPTQALVLIQAAYGVALITQGVMMMGPVHHTGVTTAAIQQRVDALKIRTAALTQRIELNHERIKSLGPVPKLGEDATKRNQLLSAISEETRSIGLESASVKTELDQISSSNKDAAHDKLTSDGWGAKAVLAVFAALAVAGAFSIASRRRELAATRQRIKLQGGAALVPSHQVKELADCGRKIEAIKVYRDQTGVSLAEAKATVEALTKA